VIAVLAAGCKAPSEPPPPPPPPPTAPVQPEAPEAPATPAALETPAAPQESAAPPPAAPETPAASEEPAEPEATVALASAEKPAPAPAPKEAAPAPNPAAKDPNLAPLEILLPKPQFTGTPKNIKFGEHQEKPSGKPRPPFYAPKGLTNVALKKPVTSSEQNPLIGDLKLITDGDAEGVEGAYVELGPGLQWVQIDLKEKCAIFAIVLWHYHGEGQIYSDVVVQAADDPDFIENVRTVYNNDFDNSAGLGLGKDLEYLETFEGRLMDAKGVRARYLRFYSNGNTSNDFNRYTEIEVFGRPAK
jgi:hypothetical protein